MTLRECIDAATRYKKRMKCDSLNTLRPTTSNMNLRRAVQFAASVFLVLQSCECGRPPQQRPKMAMATSSACPEIPPPLVMAQDNCKKMQEHTTDNMEHKNSSDVVTTMNKTEADMMTSKCYPLCLLKTLSLVDENMVPMESKMKTMMASVAMISDPKTKEMMNSLIENCLNDSKQMLASEHGAETCMAMGMSHMEDKCHRAARLISCINKGSPCPVFDDIKIPHTGKDNINV